MDVSILICLHLRKPIYRPFGAGAFLNRYLGLKPQAEPYCPFGAETECGGTGDPVVSFRSSGARSRSCYPVSANRSATRSACAAIVSAGLQAADEGKNELSTT